MQNGNGYAIYLKIYFLIKKTSIYDDINTLFVVETPITTVIKEAT